MSHLPYTRLDGPQGCMLWLMDLSQPPVDAAWQACTPAEHAQAARFHFPEHGLRYKAAHAGMRHLLSEQLGTPMSALSWTPGANGKPKLDGHPGWHFNLSHSDNWALLGISQSAPIGVDIEWCRDMRDMPGMVARMYSPQEQATFAALPDSQRTDWFYRVWSRKEACIKALGCGLSASTQAFEVGGEPIAVDTAITYQAQRCHMTVHSVALSIPAMAAVALVRDDCRHMAEAL